MKRNLKCTTRVFLQLDISYMLKHRESCYFGRTSYYFFYFYIESFGSVYLVFCGAINAIWQSSEKEGKKECIINTLCAHVALSLIDFLYCIVT